MTLKFWLSTAFSIFAGLSLLQGYADQKKTPVPAQKTAYSCISDNSGRINAAGKLGGQAGGLEYFVQDLKKPVVSITAKSDELSARMDFDSTTKKTGFCAEARLDNKSLLSGKAFFEKQKETCALQYERAFDSWLRNAAFSYTESLGRKNSRIFNADFRLNLLGGERLFSLDYNLGSKYFGFKFA